MENIKKLHPDYEYKLWTTDPDDLPQNMKEWYDKFYAIKNFVFCADILRVWAVYKYGGFYLDVDFDIKNKLDYFFEEEGVFFFHNDTDFTIPNNIFAANVGSPILEYLISRVNPECSWYGPSWMGATVKEYLKVPFQSKQSVVDKALEPFHVKYHQYWDFECRYGRHLSLYSWCPEVWEKLNKGQQL